MEKHISPKVTSRKKPILLMKPYPGESLEVFKKRITDHLKEKELEKGFPKN